MNNENIDYDLCVKQLDEILSGENNKIALLSNASAFLFDCMKNLNWCGFYIMDNNDNELVLGPFQGKIACWRIPLNKGVCGYSAKNRKSIIVDNVHDYKNHIACDSASMSELVCPIIIDDTLFGVLDIDSFKEKNFTQNDKEFIEKICKILSEKLK